MLGGFPWFSADSVFSTAARGRPLRRRQQRAHQRRRLERRAWPTGRPTATAATSGSSRAPATRGPGTRRRARLPVQHRRRTSTARRRPSASSWPAGASASPSATAATTRAPPTRTRSSPSTPAAAWPGATPSTGSPPTRPPWPTSQGNGQLDVVEGTAAPAPSMCSNGTNGAAVWSAATSGQVIGSPVTADLTGGGYQDVIVPTTNGHRHLRRPLGGRGGARSAPDDGFQSSPLVTDDPDGHIGITGAGYSTTAATCGVDHALGDRRHRRHRVERLRAGRLAAVPPRPPADRRRRHAGPAAHRGPLQRPERRPGRLPALRLRRRRLQLRQHPVLRLDRQHPPQQAGGGGRR